MVALTKDRATPQAIGDMRTGPMATDTTIFAGALVMRNAAGYLIEGQTAVGLVGVGRAEARAVNDGVDGAEDASYRPGRFRFANSGAADEITIADIGALCYAVDDQTVASTDGGATRSPAGIIENVDAQGVWVCFDEALTSIAAA